MSLEKRDQPVKPERPPREIKFRLPFFGQIRIAMEGKTQPAEKSEQFFNDIAWKILEKSHGLEYKNLHQAGDPFHMDGKVLHPVYADTMPDTTFPETHLRFYVFDSSGQERTYFNASLDKDYGLLEVFSLADTSDSVDKGVIARRARVTMATLAHLLETDQFEGFAPVHSSEDTYGCLMEMVAHLAKHPEIRPIGDLAFVLTEAAQKERDERDDPFEDPERDSHRTEWDMQAEYLENALRVGYKTTEVEELAPITVDSRLLHLFAVRPNNRYNSNLVYFCTFDENGQEVSITTARLQGDDQTITIDMPVMLPLYQQATSLRERVQKLTKTIEPVGQAVIEALRQRGEIKVNEQSGIQASSSTRWGDGDGTLSVAEQTRQLSNLTRLADEAVPRKNSNRSNQ